MGKALAGIDHLQHNLRWVVFLSPFSSSKLILEQEGRASAGDLVCQRWPRPLQVQWFTRRIDRTQKSCNTHGYEY